MNLLTINSFDCSPEASGGVNRITAILSKAFTELGINCYLGYFETLPEKFVRAPFVDRIHLNKNLDAVAFEQFLVRNHIDIVQVNFLKKENLPTIRPIYEIAHRNGVKVIYAFHMCPGFQSVTYGSWLRMLYGWQTKDNAVAETRKWLMTCTRSLWKPISHLILRDKYRIPYQYCDKIVLLSSHYRIPYSQLAGIEADEKFVAIGNALRFDAYASDADIESKEKTLLVVARFDEDTKRLSLVLKMWKQMCIDSELSDWKLQLVGDGRDLPFYEYLIQKWRLPRVEFTGLQNPQEYYRKASIFLMTSSAEGWAMVINEAAQMGTPTVAMNTFEALQDLVVPNVTGVLVKDEDVSGMAAALREIMLNPDRRMMMAKAAREHSRQFELKSIVDKWVQLFNSL